MQNTPSTVAVFAALGSAALLGSAFMFQTLGYQPCAMCLWQRWPHAIAIVVGILLLFGIRNIALYLVGFLSAGTTAALGLFHTGVERDWWEGPTSCTGSGLSSASEGLLPSSNDTGPGIVMCDEVVWEFLTLSMASWNAVFSFGLAVLWFVAIKKQFRK